MALLDARVNERTAELQSAHEQLKAEVAEKERVEAELRLAQKLEAVGQLAAGIAHEINTPIQFVSDSIYFLQEASEDLLGLVESYRQLVCDAEQADAFSEQTRANSALPRTRIDYEFVSDRVPTSCDRALRGINRVNEIIRAMREFSHPDHESKAPADLNKMIANTLTVARSEYRTVAEIETDLGSLPSIACHAGELRSGLPQSDRQRPPTRSASPATASSE